MRVQTPTVAPSASAPVPQETYPPYIPPCRRWMYRTGTNTATGTSSTQVPLPAAGSASISALRPPLRAAASAFTPAATLSYAPAATPTSTPAATLFFPPAAALFSTQTAPSTAPTAASSSGPPTTPPPPPAPLQHWQIPLKVHASPPPLPATPMTLDQALRLHRVFSVMLSKLSSDVEAMQDSLWNELTARIRANTIDRAFLQHHRTRRSECNWLRSLHNSLKATDEDVMARRYASVRAAFDASLGMFPVHEFQSGPWAESARPRNALVMFYEQVYLAATGMNLSGKRTAARVDPVVIENWMMGIDFVDDITEMWVGNRRVVGWVSIFQNDEEERYHHDETLRRRCLCCARR